ncbi:hypothetical protein VM1G_05720 [Cytospora mali]|uniref:Uncharacterized protein n=1 Tax=Cytospora mali TaxID=578113 RepID=A0A194W374_CYTMA|nr:hypothetical protein VM1G_05720 [Valsa mali]
MQTPLSPSPSSSQKGLQVLCSSFTTPGRGNGSVTFNIQPDNDPVKYGLDLLFPTTPSSELRGFPVCEAVVKTEKRGYASMYGWTQLVKDSTMWEFDPLPITEKLVWPFCWFGPEPTLFDGPIRIGVKDIDWTARSFLTYIEDTVISKNVTYLCGFEWGFQMSNGTINIKTTKKLTPAEWNGHVEYLSRKFSSWTFMSVPEQ